MNGQPLKGLDTLRIGVDIDRGKRRAVRLCRVRIRRMSKDDNTIADKTCDWEPAFYWLWWVGAARDGRDAKDITDLKQAKEMIFPDRVLPSQRGGMAKWEYEIEHVECRFNESWFKGGKAKKRSRYLTSLMAMAQGEEEEYNVAELLEEGNKKIAGSHTCALAIDSD